VTDELSKNLAKGWWGFAPWLMQRGSARIHVHQPTMANNDFNLAEAPPLTNDADLEIAPQRLEIHIPWITFIKVFTAMLCGYAAYVLWPLLLLVFLALFLAVTLHAFVDWLNGRGMKHCASLLVVIGILLLALSVSPKTAIMVVALYLLFHALEIYYIVPKVYGKHLRVSTLTVLLGLLAGTLLAGITGALAALPIIASYSAIERIWLRRFLRDGAAEKHTEQKNQEFGEKT
jgi:predicted PurR-regulated permease PerM